MYSFFMHKVYFCPNNFTGCVQFVLRVCYNVILECYQNTSTVDVPIFSDYFILCQENGICGDT